MVRAYIKGLYDLFREAPFSNILSILLFLKYWRYLIYFHLLFSILGFIRLLWGGEIILKNNPINASALKMAIAWNLKSSKWVLLPFVFFAYGFVFITGYSLKSVQLSFLFVKRARIFYFRFSPFNILDFIKYFLFEEFIATIADEHLPLRTQFLFRKNIIFK
jgi:hypothetical protein